MKQWAVTGLVVVTHQALSFYRISIPLALMQQAIAGQFPIERQKYFFTVTLMEPLITLDAAQNRLGLALTVQLAGGETVVARWRGHLDGVLEYRQQPGAFYFTHPRLRDMDTNGRLTDIQGTLQRLIETVLAQMFAVTPLYQLQRNNVSHVLARLLLKNVTIERERIVVQLGLY